MKADPLLFFCMLCLFFLGAAPPPFSADADLKATADILFWEGRPKEAEGLYRQWLQQPGSASHPAFASLLFRTVSLQEDPTAAVGLLQSRLPLLTRPADQLAAHTFIADQYELCGDFDSAARSYRTALDLVQTPALAAFRDQQPLLTYRLASVQAEMGYTDRALQTLRPLTLPQESPLSPLQTAAKMLVSRLLAEQGQVSEAVQAASEVLSQDPKHFPDVVWVWVPFLIDRYPTETAALHSAWKRLQSKRPKLPYPALPTPSMILAGLYPPTDEAAEPEPVNAQADNAQAGATPSPAPGAAAAAPGVAAADSSAAPGASAADSAKPPASFLIQVAGFSDPENARELALVLQRSHFSTRIRSDGKVHRLFVVPQPGDSLPELTLRLKDLGYEGMVTEGSE